MCGIWAIIGDTNVACIHASIRSFMTLKNRGPDATRFELTDRFWMGFHELVVDNNTVKGQPFHLRHGEDIYYIICDGEIYNSRELKDHFNLHTVNSECLSSCDIILPLFQMLGFSFTQLNQLLHGEYSMIIIKESKGKEIEFFASTDPLSVRPLFMCVNEDETLISFSSTMQGHAHLKGEIVRVQQCTRIIGAYRQGKVTYHQERYNVNLSNIPPIVHDETYDLHETIVLTLKRCVERRLNVDGPVGCLLSGGLDSSLVAALASRKLKEKGETLRTFSIGMEGSKDLHFATIVAEYIGSIHTNIVFSPEEGIQVISDVIRTIESYDVTTVRASVSPYLLAKWIKQHTDIKILLTGDGADECEMGYSYFNMAPSDEDAQKESCRLIDEIHFYDGLRIDRCVAVHGLQARIPYLDKEFVDLYKSINPSLKRPHEKRIEKALIRKAFDVYYKSHNEPILPTEVLYRRKETFSEGVSNQEKPWYKYLQEHFNKEVCEENLMHHSWTYLSPASKEAYYYRYMFECLLSSKCSLVIPHCCLPPWCEDQNVVDCY